MLFIHPQQLLACVQAYSIYTTHPLTPFPDHFEANTRQIFQEMPPKNKNTSSLKHNHNTITTLLEKGIQSVQQKGLLKFWGRQRTAGQFLSWDSLTLCLKIASGLPN